MNRPKKPVEPRAPNEPRKPEPTREIEGTLVIRDYTTVSIADILKKSQGRLDLVYPVVFAETNWDDPPDIKIELQFMREVPVSEHEMAYYKKACAKYEEECQKYTEKLKQYEAARQKYKEDIAKFELFKAEATVTKLKKKIQKSL